MPSKIVLVTVTYNGRSVWAPFLACLRAQAGVPWHLVVVDNASTDGIREDVLAIDDDRVTVIANAANLGVAAANNQGIAWAMEHGAERIVLINNDTEFASDLLARMVAELDASGADAISPVIPFYDRPDTIWYAGGGFSRRRGIMNTHDHVGAPLSVVGITPFFTDYAPTCCVMFDRNVFHRIGTMDERYFVYWDDTDFLWRMKVAGMRVVVDPRIVLLHKVSVSTGGRLSDFSIRYNFRNQIFFVRKFFSAPWAIYTAALAALAGLMRVFAGGDSFHHFVARLKAIREGFTMQVGTKR